MASEGIKSDEKDGRGRIFFSFFFSTKDERQRRLRKEVEKRGF